MTTKRLAIQEDYIPLKRSRYCDHTKLLPDEILIYIFSFFTHKQLYNTLRRVCRRWYFLTATPALWRKILAPEEVPSNILCSWLEHAPLLTELELIGRNDINAVAKKVSKFCKNLQSLKIENSNGTKKSELLESKTLCQMLNNCKYLTNLYFSGVKILSCKFFQILSKRKPLGSTKKCSYFGPVSQRQMKALIESIVSSDSYDAATLFTSGNKKISIKEISGGGEDVPNIDTIWNDIMNHFDESEDVDADYFPPMEEDVDVVV